MASKLHLQPIRMMQSLRRMRDIRLMSLHHIQSPMDRHFSAAPLTEQKKFSDLRLKLEARAIDEPTVTTRGREGFALSFIQLAAQRMLKEIDDETKRTGGAVELLPFVRHFAFEGAMQFMFGPLMDRLGDEDQKRCFQLFQAAHCKLADETSRVRARLALREYLRKQTNGRKLFGFEADCLFESLKDNESGRRMKVDAESYEMTMLSLLSAVYDTSARLLINLVHSTLERPERTEAIKQAILSDPRLSDPKSTLNLGMLKRCDELESFILDSFPFQQSLVVPLDQLHHTEGLVLVKNLVLLQARCFVVLLLRDCELEIDEKNRQQIVI